MKTRTIPTISPHDFEILARHNPNLLHESPWIVDGYIQHWPAFEPWREMGNLRREFGHLEAFAKAPNFITNRKSRLVSVRTTFEKYLDYIDHPERVEQIYDGCWLEGNVNDFRDLNMPLYCGTLRIVHKADDPIFKNVNPLLPRPLQSWNHALPYYYTLFNHFWLLVSLPGALTPLHTDNNGTIALIAQLRGRKRATLYSPADLPHVRTPSGDFLDPKCEDDPEFATASLATKWIGDIEQGQVLFVGTNWAHHVETLETSVSVSFDFVDSTNIAVYATSTGWASAFGARAKRNPQLFINRLQGSLTTEAIETSSPVTLGRIAMAKVLQSLLQSHENPELNAIRMRYAVHLGETLAEIDRAA